jgi:ESCRT-I complex subunit VPS28
MRGMPSNKKNILHKLAERVLRDKMTTETFMAIYQMDCPRAVERLLKMGTPEPMKGGTDDANHAVSVAETVQMFRTAMDAVKLEQRAVSVAETVQMFRTAMDAVKLEQRAVDELLPLLVDLMDTLTRVPDTQNDFEPNRKAQKWVLEVQHNESSRRYQ